MAHLFVLENSKRHILKCGQGAKPWTTHLPVLCSVSAYPIGLYPLGDTFINFCALSTAKGMELKMRKLLVYTGVLVVFILLMIFINKATFMATRPFDYLNLGFLFIIIGSFLFGVFLGSFNFIRDWKVDGQWKVDKVSLLALGLPLFILLLLVYITYLGMRLPQAIHRLIFYILANNMFEYISIFLGYITISSFAKKGKLIVNVNSDR
ncbi:hypothetical protein [Desulfosporosinus youngiae]|uniref:Uncharacterized protein n=1 Tax=Desulfosporosinus youngiae DSM 17734 TaxID=768710 RepID=H5XXG2_9FIRM|nr:hypothetical protein [Desulfosporosinus youngiae]EHQ91168.1 hypothetical protein DesyoDRAFT_4210 [Desulfosporosinus youngiae DSM 17734]